jgi:hypothetical protein
VNVLIGLVQQRASKVLIIIDGLDRIESFERGLAHYSGGRAREFVVFLRRLAELAWDADASTATREMVDRVLDERRRRRETGLHRGHIRLLEAVAADPDHRLPEDELAYKLLTYGALLPYPDGSEWYYPHPLLTMNLVRVKPTGSGR